MSDSTPGAALLRVIVSTEDLDRACAFYSGVLGLAIRRRAGDLVHLDVPGGQELLLHRRRVDRGDAAVAAGFRVEDVRATADRWRGAGGEILEEPAAQPWGEVMAVVRDPDGHVVCLSEIPAGR